MRWIAGNGLRGPWRVAWMALSLPVFLLHPSNITCSSSIHDIIACYNFRIYISSLVFCLSVLRAAIRSLRRVNQENRKFRVADADRASTMTTNTTSVSSVSGRKRRRPAVVCNECRRRKIACDRHTPCGQCVQHKSACTYSTHSHSPSDERRTGRRTWPGPAPPPHSNSNSDTSVPSAPLSAASNLEISAILQPSVGIHGNAALRPAYAVGSRDVNAIRVAPAGLQQSVTGPTVNGINLQNLNVRSNVNGPDRSADTSAEAASSPPAVVAHARHRLNGRVDKARLFGQSHWMNSLLQVRILLEISFLPGSPGVMAAHRGLS